MAGIEDTQVGKLTIPVEFQVDKKALQGKFKADVEREAKAIGKRQAEVQATEFVQQLERQYQRQLGEAREELYRGLIDPKEFERRGREAARRMNAAILDEVERRGKAGRLGAAYTDEFNALTGAFKNVGTDAKRGSAGVGEMRESFASLLAQAAGVHPVLGRVVNVMGGLAAGSVVMGAVLAGLSALVFAWQKVTEAAREAREEQEDALERLKALQQEQQLGPRGQTGADIDLQRRRQQEIRDEQARLRQAFREGRSYGAPARIALLQEEYDEIEAAIQAGERELGETEAQETRAAERRVHELREQIRRERETERREAEREAASRAQELARAEAALATAEGQLQQRLAALTATATDDLLLAIDKLESDAREAAAKAGQEISQEFLANLDLLRADASATGRLEGFQEQLGNILRLDRGAFQQRALGGFIEKMKQEASTLQEGSKARKAYLDLVEKAEDAHRKNADAIDRETDAQERGNEAAEERRRQEELRDLRERARLLEENARAAIQLANAVGLIGDEAAATFSAIAQLGSALYRIFSGPEMDLSAIPSAVGALAQVMKGLFGRSDQEIRERQRQVTAMANLTRALDDLRKAVAGDLTETERATLLEKGGLIADIAQAQGGRKGLDATQTNWLRRIAELVGISFEDIVPEAGRINVEVLREALAALRDLSIGAFGTSLQDRLDALDFVVGQLGDHAGTATEQLTRFLDVIAGAEGGRASRFAEAFRKVFDEEGATAAEAFIQALAQRFADNDQSLFGAGGLFEGLTADEVRRLLEESNGYLERLTSGTPGSTQDFVQARSITQVTGSRIEAALYTENALSSERNALLRQLVGQSINPTLVAGFTPGGIDPALLGAPAAAEGGVSVSVNVEALNFNGGGSGDGLVSDAQLQAGAERAGRVIGRAAAAEMDRALGRKFRNRRRDLGRA